MSDFEERDADDQEMIVPERPDYAEEIIKIIKSDDSLKQIGEQLEDYHENDIAETLPLLSVTERKKLYHILGKDKTSEIFTYLDDVVSYIEEMDAENAADIIEVMDADDAVDVLEGLEEESRQEIESLLEEYARKDIELISSYSEDEIGSKMTTNFIVMNKDLTITEAMKSLVKQAAENDNIYTIYAVNDDGTFYGALGLSELIIARKEDELDKLIQTSYPYVYAQETIDECFEELKGYSEDSIPVLNNDKRILGVITLQDIVEVVDEEMGEDYAKLGGLIAEEDLKEPLMESMKKRIPWLIILLGLGLIVSSVVGLFEHVVAELTLIVCFQSLILDMSGNVGTQSLAVTIRVLMDEELDIKQKAGLVIKEMKVGFVNGLALGIISFFAIGLFVFLFRSKTLLFSFAISGCIGIALLLSMVISSFTGTIIPIFFKKIGVDPAVASGPLITTVNDLVAVVTYYGLTWIFLINILHLAE